jgi:hypothetical protein
MLPSGIRSNPFDTSINNVGTPAVFGVFLEVAVRRAVAMRVTIDLRLVAFHAEVI